VLGKAGAGIPKKVPSGHVSLLILEMGAIGNSSPRGRRKRRANAGRRCPGEIARGHFSLKKPESYDKLFNIGMKRAGRRDPRQSLRVALEVRTRNEEGRINMAVKIVIRREVSKDKEAKLLPLLIKLRALAAAQPGYISGETLRNVDAPDEFLVISTWQSVEEWKKWLETKQRQDIQAEIDRLLGKKTDYGVYFYG
jgi:heme-degrading monooxygenase HmoA